MIMELMNYSEFDSFDDMLNSTYRNIMEKGFKTSGKRGEIKEKLNYAATLLNPRSRVSQSLDRRLIRSKFAELAWYLTKDTKKNYINPYISAYNSEESENSKILGGYGPKLFGNKKSSQYSRICSQIIGRKETKQAYLVISDQTDYKVRNDKHSSPPCTIGLHFIVRNNRLNLTTYMRSNDAYFGLPHDLFCFTMLQEMVAVDTSIELGYYTHVCTSMHIYEKHYHRVNQYLSEGLMEDILMPKMSDFNQTTLTIVQDSFDESIEDFNGENLNNYWFDYCLFSNRYKPVSNKEWLTLFKTEEMKNIALNSITK